MKLWVDDIRVAPEGWLWAKTSEQALSVLRATYSALVSGPNSSVLDDADFEAIAFDHDLGGNDDSRRVLTWIIEYNFWPAEIFFLTSNPPGRKWLVGSAQSYAPDFVRIHA